MEKTNVMRLLDAAKIPYGSYEYAAPDGALSGVEVARQLGLEEERVFKTLVTQASSGKYYVFVSPVAEELNLKKAASAVHEKKIEMIKSRELLPLTGYIHGGCSPIGMTKHFPTFFHQTALDFPYIYVSAGQRGLQIKLAPQDLIRESRGTVADLTQEQ